MSEAKYSETVLLPKTDFPMKADLTRREPDFLKKWQEMDIYNKILAKNKGKQHFILHDGPPYANGHIHLGTALNKILKDTIVKFKSFQGFYAPYVPGWDCHGMPIEHQVFQQLKLMDKNSVDIVAFRKKTYDYAMKFVGIQKGEFQRLGVFADWQHPYLTLNPEYEKTIIDSFGKLFTNGYIIQRFKPIYWCWHCQTALAEAELEYWDETGPSIYVKFPVKKTLKTQNLPENTCFLIWTTTPWTLPANVAIAIHPGFEYCLIKTAAGHFIIADALVGKISEKMKWKVEIITRFKGKDLEQMVCTHPFIERDSPIILADYVSDKEGTGCVHIAPGHGEEDYQTSLKYNLPILSPVDETGRFTEQVAQLKGMLVFDADPLIVEKLTQQNIILYSESYQHSYPHCWRCKKPVIFRATKQWFLKIDHKNLRHLLRESIQKTKWIPEEGMSRILGMVEMRPDWCLSRQRLWGVALPIVYCENCNSPICNEQTINRVLELISGHGSDIWFEKDLSEILPKNFACPHCGGSVFRKEQDILDVWFDSGVSHLAVLKNHPQLKWPADFYLEGSDQHRGWFQTSLITSCAIENQPPFKNVLTHGFVVDAEGRKMSKSLGNIITPEEIIKRYGADILRLWALSENYQQDMRISQTIIDHLVIVYRTLRNTIRFMLGNLYDYDASVKISESDFLEVDRWAIARLNQLVQDVARYYESCLFHKGLNEIFNFCNIDMSSFYLDYLKDRLYTHAKDSPSRRAGQNVLYQILTHLVIMLAPVLSFTCEEAYSYIPGRKTDSVFLEQWPEIQKPETALLERWQKFFEFRRMVLKQIEEKRVAGQLGSSLEASIEIKADADFRRFLESFQPHLTGLLMIAECKIIDGNSIQITAKKTHLQKCSRCWIHHSTIGRFSQHPQLCEKCFAVVDSLGK